MEYEQLREERCALVRSAVTAVVELTCLRGSWVGGDFHLSIISGLSFSDVDLSSSEAKPVSDKIIQRISERLVKAGFPLRVSAHREEDLAQVTLEDAGILKIAEYLSKVPSESGDSQYVNYWRAKTVLLLLQSKVNEGYRVTSDRIGTPEARNAFAVKLGIESVFSSDSAARLIEHFGNDTARDFLEQCLVSGPGPAYREEIASRVCQCQSVSPWLRDYILKKMNSLLA